MGKKTILSVFLILALFGGGLALAEDWPHWRGPQFDGTSSEQGLPVEWGPEKNVEWRLELPGAAASTPVVVGGKILLTSATQDQADLQVLAVDPGGEVVWQRKVSEGSFDFRGGLAQFKHETNPASPSPVSDGENVWVLFGNGLLAALDLDGKVLWSQDLTKQHGEFQYYFGLSSSPFVHGDRLFLQILNTNSQLLLALDKKTGKILWKKERATDARAECLHSYASPAVFDLGAKTPW